MESIRCLVSEQFPITILDWNSPDCKAVLFVSTKSPLWGRVLRSTLLQCSVRTNWLESNMDDWFREREKKELLFWERDNMDRLWKRPLVCWTKRMRCFPGSMPFYFPCPCLGWSPDTLDVCGQSAAAQSVLRSLAASTLTVFADFCLFFFRLQPAPPFSPMQLFTRRIRSLSMDDKNNTGYVHLFSLPLCVNDVSMLRNVRKAIQAWAWKNGIKRVTEVEKKWPLGNFINQGNEVSLLFSTMWKLETKNLNLHFVAVMLKVKLCFFCVYMYIYVYVTGCFSITLEEKHKHTW